jgi:polar amino acid transport system substrate-binding protein
MINFKRQNSAIIATALISIIPSLSAAESATDVLDNVAINDALAERVPAAIRSAGVLNIGSDNAYAPWEYLADGDGQTPEGIDVDLAKALGITLGLEVDFQTSAFDAIIPSLGTKFDLGWSALTVTEARMENVNFVTYAASGNLWAVKTGNPSGFDPASFCGTTIATQTGSWNEERIVEASDACVAEGNEAIEILPFRGQPEAITRVAVGGADATVSGEATIGYAALQSRGVLETLEAVGGKLGEVGIVGIAVVKEDAELTALVADAMNELIANGTYAAVYAHWGVDGMAIEASEVRSAEGN